MNPDLPVDPFKKYQSHAATLLVFQKFLQITDVIGSHVPFLMAWIAMNIMTIPLLASYSALKKG